MTYYCISDSENPYFNLAAEELLMRQKGDDFIFFYINQPSVIVGKHQNAVAEANIPFLFKNNILLARRASGGGTVYHDRGNLNFCFILSGQQDKLVDFRKYTQPILDALHAIEVDARFGKRSDLVLNEKKISGNAEHIFKNRVLHHGTLLYNTSLENLENSIQAGRAQITHKAVKSVRSQVTNIAQVLKPEMSMQQFVNHVVSFTVGGHKDIQPYRFSRQDLQSIQSLVENKYSTPGWVYAYSPDYTFEKEIKFGTGKAFLVLKVEKGLICQMEWNSGTKERNVGDKLRNMLLGKLHCPETFNPLVINTLEELVKQKITEAETIECFF